MVTSCQVAKHYLFFSRPIIFLAGADDKNSYITATYLLHEIVYSKVLAFENFALKSTGKKCHSKVCETQ